MAQKHAEVHVKGFVFANRIDYVLECYFSSLSSITEKKKAQHRREERYGESTFFHKTKSDISQWTLLLFILQRL